MSQVVENRSQVTVAVVGPPTTGPSPGWRTCRVRVLAAEPVAGYPNLLGAELPRELTALYPEAVGAVLSEQPSGPLLASLAGPGTMRILPDGG